MNNPLTLSNRGDSQQHPQATAPNPDVAAVLTCLDIRLEDELQRYRRQKRIQQAQNQPPVQGSPHSGPLELLGLKRSQAVGLTAVSQKSPLPSLLVGGNTAGSTVAPSFKTGIGKAGIGKAGSGSGVQPFSAGTAIARSGPDPQSPQSPAAPPARPAPPSSPAPGLGNYRSAAAPVSPAPVSPAPVSPPPASPPSDWQVDPWLDSTPPPAPVPTAPAAPPTPVAPPPVSQAQLLQAQLLQAQLLQAQLLQAQRPESAVDPVASPRTPEPSPGSRPSARDAAIADSDRVADTRVDSSMAVETPLDGYGDAPLDQHMAQLFQEAFQFSAFEDQFLDQVASTSQDDGVGAADSRKADTFGATAGFVGMLPVAMETTAIPDDIPDSLDLDFAPGDLAALENLDLNLETAADQPLLSPDPLTPDSVSTQIQPQAYDQSRALDRLEELAAPPHPTVTNASALTLAGSQALSPLVTTSPVPELGASELGASELGIAELGIAELGIAELGIAELGTSELTEPGATGYGSGLDRADGSPEPGDRPLSLNPVAADSHLQTSNFLAPDDYLASSEALLDSLPEDEPTAMPAWVEGLFSPLGLGSLLLLLLSSATLGYVIMNPTVVGNWGIDRWFSRSSPDVTTPAPEPVDPDPTAGPDLAAKEFVDLGLDNLSTVSPQSPSPAPGTPPGTPPPGTTAPDSAAPPGLLSNLKTAIDPTGEVTGNGVSPADTEAAPAPPAAVAPAAPRSAPAPAAPRSAPAPVTPPRSAPAPAPVALPAPTLAPPAPTAAVTVPATLSTPPVPDNPPAAAGFRVVTPYTSDRLLDQAQETVPDAYLKNSDTGANIQFGSFGDRDSAESLVQQLQEQGIDAQIQEP